jgi:hypothetical protein
MAPAVRIRARKHCSATKANNLISVGMPRSLIWATIAAPLLLARLAAPAWALDACGGCGTRTASWVAPLIIVAVVIFLAVVVRVSRRQARSRKTESPAAAPQGSDVAADRLPIRNHHSASTRFEATDRSIATPREAKGP